MRFALTLIVALAAHLALLAVPWGRTEPPLAPKPGVLRFVVQDKPARSASAPPAPASAPIREEVEPAPPPQPETPPEAEETPLEVEEPQPEIEKTPPVVEEPPPPPPIEPVAKKPEPKPKETPKPRPKNVERPKPPEPPKPEPPKPEPVKPKPEPPKPEPVKPVEPKTVEKIEEPRPAPKTETPAPSPAPVETATRAASLSASALPDAPLAATSSPGDAGEPVDVDFGEMDGPRIASRIAPRYPSSAKRRGEEGTVVLLLSIDEEGALTNVKVLRSAGDKFDQAALAAARKARYAPATRDGRPVACRAKLPIRFSLRSFP